MTNKNIYRSLGGLDPELIAKAAPAEKVQKKKKNDWVKWVSIAACFVLVAGSILGAPSIMELFNYVEPSDTIDYELPTDIDKIHWAGNGQSNEVTDVENVFVTWNGWSMKSSLYDVLNRADDTDFIAVIVKKNDSADLNAFEYKGTTLVQLRAESDELDLLAHKLIDFHKEGEWLKYVELLYTTGTPDGVTWSKPHYDERVAFYGEDFIAKYIVDGEVQTELLNEDYVACQIRICEKLKEINELLKAYHESYVDDLEDVFVSSGTCTIAHNGSVFLFVRKDELAKLNVEGKKDYMLSLAKRSAFEENSNSNTPTLDDLD
ncbi:MAG: hypothetical protein ACI3XI_09545 [Eubacteriales bacterium]